MNYALVSYWSQMAAFVLFAVALVWTWQKYVMPAVARAQQATNDRIALAERHRDEMQAALEGLRHEIDGARQDAAAILERAEIQAQREYEQAVAEATEAGERELHGAAGELERARLSARDRLHDELLDKAVARAQAEAQRRIDDALDAVLVERFLATLERKA